MNDRVRALALLRQAREILARRMTEYVLENAEEILDDARGDSYMGEIETLYERIGTPLAHLNQMLSNLPADEEVHTHDAHAVHPAAHSYAEVVPPAWPELPALPAPRGSTTVEAVLEEPATDVSFQTFALQIQAGDVVAAGQSLAVLFDIAPERAAQCAGHFRQQMLEDPDFLLKAVQLRRELQSGGYNAVLMLLFQCFGLSGIESLGVLHVLKIRYSS